MPLGMKVGLGPATFVLDGDLAAPPQFLAHIHCGQTSVWIKTALTTEVDLGPGHTMLDRDPAPLPKRGQSPPIFGPFL